MSTRFARQELNTRYSGFFAGEFCPSIAGRAPPRRMIMNLQLSGS